MLTKAIILSQLSAEGVLEYGVSIGGPNPDPSDYHASESLERAVSLCSLINKAIVEINYDC